MNKLGKFVLFLFMILYIVSPVDAFPGPIDDAIVLLVGIAAARNNQKRIRKK